MKKLFMACLLLAGSMSMGAQEWRIGVEGGMNVNSPKELDTKVGYRVGLRGELDFGEARKGAFLSMGLLLSEKGSKSDNYYVVPTGAQMKWTMHNTYLEIPLHAGYRFAVGRNASLFASAGPYLGVGLFGKSRQTTTVGTSETTTTVAKNIFHHQHRIDAGLGLRLGVELKQHYQISAAYDWGLTSLRSVPSGATKERNRNFSLSFTYMF